MTARILAASAALIALVEILSWSAAKEASSADAHNASSLRQAQELDAGTSAGRLSEEDRELLENFELLQHLDDWRDLEVLLELSKPG